MKIIPVPNQHRTAIILAATLTAAIGLTFASCATPAHATEPEPTATPIVPGYHLLLWEVPGGAGSVWEPDQILVDHVLLTEPSLDVLDFSAALKCGSYYQVDLEHNSAITDALVAGGVLHNPNDPQEDHAYGAVAGNPWKYITTPDCAPEPPVCAEGEELQPADTPSGYVCGPADEPCTAGGLCPSPSSTPTETFPPALPLDPITSLPVTGVNDALFGGLTVTAIIMVLLGMVMWAFFGTWQANHKSRDDEEEK